MVTDRSRYPHGSRAGQMMNILKTLPPRATPSLPPRSSKILNYGWMPRIAQTLVSVKRDEITLTGTEGSSQRLTEVFDGKWDNGWEVFKGKLPKRFC